jgi:hypothetical protein
MYCTAVSRSAETFSSRPNINPQFLQSSVRDPCTSAPAGIEIGDSDGPGKPLES